MKLSTVLDAVAFRTTRRYNVVHIRSLAPNYYDTDTRLLHSMMDLLTDYVEVELAYNELLFQKNKLTLRQKIHTMLPYILKPLVSIRSRELGLAHLDWEINLQDDLVPDQSRIASDVKALYLWWQDERPARKSPDAEIEKLLDANITKEEEERLLKESFELEKKYYDEDTEKLKLLIDIRGYLWT